MTAFYKSTPPNYECIVCILTLLSHLGFVALYLVMTLNLFPLSSARLILISSLTYLSMKNDFHMYLSVPLKGGFCTTVLDN